MKFKLVGGQKILYLNPHLIDFSYIVLSVRMAKCGQSPLRQYKTEKRLFAKATSTLLAMSCKYYQRETMAKSSEATEKWL